MRHNTFFVDYENVNRAGLEGVETLPKSDRVVIFYSDHAPTIDIDVLVKCRAKLDFIRVDNRTSNALDFQLVAHLFHKMRKRRRYYIISKDQGFIAAISVEKKYGSFVEEYISIADAVIDSEKCKKKFATIKEIVELAS